MKMILMTVVFAFSTAALAADGDAFAERKAHLLKNVDERIKMNQEFKTCVEGAQDHEALKKCHLARREEGKAFREQRKEMRKRPH